MFQNSTDPQPQAKAPRPTVTAKSGTTYYLRTKTNPSCRARIHNSANAARQEGCVCVVALELAQEKRERETAARAVARAAERERQGKPRKLSPPQPGPRDWPAPAPIGEAGRVVVSGEKRAACKDADPSWFFDPSAEEEAIAKSVCAGCPVLFECFAHAMRHEAYGIWGGLTEDERRTLRARGATGEARSA